MERMDRRCCGVAVLLTAVAVAVPGSDPGDLASGVSTRLASPPQPAPAIASGASLRRGATPDTAERAPLFSSTDALVVTLVADLAALRDDRSESPDRPGTLTVVIERAEPAEIPVEIRTRGSFRLDPGNCTFPPLRIDIDDDDAAGTPFEGQDDLKLVSSCRPERASFEELVAKEYLAYRSVDAVTPASFGARLLELTLVDTGAEGGDVDEAGIRPRVAFVIEDDDAVAARLDGTVFDLEEGMNLPPSAFDPISRMTNAVAQYMVGNPDWSDVAAHNVEIIDRGGVALAVPYDFDFSGLVDAPYATPPPEYRLDSVRERYYRGWCENPLTTSEVLERFRSARDEILRRWRVESRLSEDARSRGIRYLEAFFDDIETDERAERRFLRDCRSVAR